MVQSLAEIPLNVDNSAKVIEIFNLALIAPLLHPSTASSKAMPMPGAKSK